jgi:hypothetical protein
MVSTVSAQTQCPAAKIAKNRQKSLKMRATAIISKYGRHFDIENSVDE